MGIYKRFQTVILATMLIFTSFSMAHALPSAEFTYVETALDEGMWRYDYTLYNTSDPILDVGFDIYEVFFTFDDMKYLSSFSLPNDWDLLAGVGFGNSVSLITGTPPVGADIAPGTFLDGFTFLFDYQAGALPYEVSFTNPEDGNNPIIENGVSMPESITVPEPATMICFIFALGGMVIARRFGITKYANL